MRPNLSLEKIAGALAVLGTSVVLGCGGGDKPAASPDVKANEVAPTSDKSATGQGHCGADHKEHKPGEASCGAKGGSASCGAGKGGSASCGASKSAGDTSAAGGKPADATATPASTGATPATPATPSTGATPAKPGDKPADKAAPAKPGAAPAGKKAGASSCGAGTCSAKK